MSPAMRSVRSVRKSLLVAVLALALLAGLAGCSKGKKPKPEPSLIDKIPLKQAVLKIDGKDISGAWLRNWCITQMMTVRAASGGAPMKVDEYSLIEGGMEFLGKEYVIAMEAQRRGITVSDDEIANRLAKEAARFESSDKWKQTLEKSGLTVDERKQEIKIELLVEKYRDQVAAPIVREKLATDENAKTYYDKFPQLWKEPRRIHLQHIARSVAKDATDDVKRKEREAIEKARTRILGGEKFEAVAREVSTEATAMKGGEIGWVTEDVPIQPQLKPVVMALKAGEMTPVLESPQGYHLFKAVEVKEAGTRSYADAKDDIKKRMYDRGLTLEMETTARKLTKQLIDQDKYRQLDLKLVLGPKPATPPPGQAPKGPGAPAPPNPAGEAANAQKP